MMLKRLSPPDVRSTRQGSRGAALGALLVVVMATGGAAPGLAQGATRPGQDGTISDVALPTEPRQPLRAVPPRGSIDRPPPPPVAAGLTPEHLAESLARRGYGQIADLRRRGNAYILEAVSRRGQRVKLVVDSGTGEILGLRVLSFPDRSFEGVQRRPYGF